MLNEICLGFFRLMRALTTQRKFSVKCAHCALLQRPQDPCLAPMALPGSKLHYCSTYKCNTLWGPALLRGNFLNRLEMQIYWEVPVWYF